MNKTLKYIMAISAIVLIAAIGTSFAITSRLGEWYPKTLSYNGKLFKTADYTVTTADNGKQIEVTATSANITITLPTVASSMAGGTMTVGVIKKDATTYTVVVTPATGDTVGGESTRKLVSQNSYMILKAGPGKDWTVEYESPYVVEDYEAGTVSFVGLNTFTADVSITGTTPELTIGDGGDEDITLIFSGSTDSFYIAHDAADDDLNIGYGGSTEAAAGTQTAIEITDSATPAVTIPNDLTVNGNATLGNAVTDSITITGAVQGATFMVADGATDNTNTVSFTLDSDPASAITVTVPVQAGTLAMTTGVGSTTGIYSAVTTSQTLTSASCGITFGIATDALVMTLPSTVSGCNLCFANQGASGNNIITLSPAAADKVWGGAISASAVVTTIAGADDEDVINTKATAIKGDIMCLLGDGTDGWLITKATGTWAEASP